MPPRPLPWTAESAFAKFQQALPELQSLSEEANEAETRLKVINAILFDVLDWDKSDVEVELYTREVGYADYVFSIEKTIAIVVEAKRAGLAFTIPGTVFQPEPITFALLEKESKETGAAMRQSLGYAASLGARYIAISNGAQWIIALTYVQSQKIEDREVIVFDSLSKINDKFRRFWTCFSKSSIAENEIYPLLMESRKKPAPAKFSQSIPGYPVASERNVFKNELSYILEMVWDVLGRTENTLPFLEACYVPPAANGNLVSSAEDVLRRRLAADESTVATIINEDVGRIKDAIIGYANEKPFVVLGDVGRGKSTFLSFLRLVGAKKTLESYIQLQVNFLDRPDSSSEVTDFIYNQLEAQFLDRYEIDIMEDHIVRGALHTEIKRFHKGTLYKSYEGDSESQKREENSFINQHFKDRHVYFQSIIRHLKRGRGKSIAIFFDNLDRRDPEIQEQAFLKASSIARDWECVVFICLRPSTFYDSLKGGVLDSLAPRTFTLGSADLSLIMKRRFSFAEKLALGSVDTPLLQNALKDKAVSFQLPRVAQIFACCEFSARRNANAIQMLAALSNGNIRALLDLTKRVLTSGHLDTQKIFDEIQKVGDYYVPSFEAVKTLLYGDYNHFDPQSSVFVNLFDVYHADPKEHFIRCLILDYLTRFHDQEQGRTWVEYSALITYLESFYFDIATIQRHLTILIDARCIEAAVAPSRDEAQISTLRITTRGVYHITNLVKEFQYLDAMYIDTPILDYECRKQIQDEFSLERRIERTKEFLKYLGRCIDDLADIEGRTICTRIVDAGLAECNVVEQRAFQHVSRHRQHRS